MGVRFPSVFTAGFLGPLPANANETIVCTTPPINEPIDNAQILLSWGFSARAGTGQTSAAFNIRRGPLITSPTFQNGAWSILVTAGSAYAFSCGYGDSPGVVAGVQYTLTVQQVGATAAGTFRDCYLIAMVL